MPRPERLACLIAGRNLGDIVFARRFLCALTKHGYAEQYVVWTRPQLAFLFDGIANCEIVSSQFPVGTSKNFGIVQACRFLGAARELRRLRPSVTIDLVGDIRERIFARLAGGARHVFPGWAPGHPFGHVIRNPFGVGHPTVVVPADRPSVYGAHDLLFQTLMPEAGQVEASEIDPHARGRGVPRVTVGLHPFASQACKLWPAERWQEVARRLLAQGAAVRLFGAPHERAALEAMAKPLTDRPQILCGDLASFSHEVAQLDVLVGLDSFAVHMAHRHHVRSVTVFGGNPPAMWTPPDGLGLGSSGGCSSYPCFNVPTCVGGDSEYACVRSISVDDVLTAIDAQTHGSALRRSPAPPASSAARAPT